MREMEINDFVESSSPVRRDQEIANNFGQCNIITECLSEEYSDCTSSYTNKLFERNLLCEQWSHKVSEKKVEGVQSITTSRAPDPLNPTNKENDDGI